MSTSKTAFDLKTASTELEFSITPMGYNKRNVSTLSVLAIHPNVVVRTAVAQVPQLRDFFIEGMLAIEKDGSVRKILEQRMVEVAARRKSRGAAQSAKVKEQAQELEALKAKYAELENKIEKKDSKKTVAAK